MDHFPTKINCPACLPVAAKRQGRGEIATPRDLQVTTSLPPFWPLVNSSAASIAIMARSTPAAANGCTKRKDVAVNGTASSDSTTAAVDDAKYRDFFWTYTEEPHRTRRLAIIKAHPEVSPTLSNPCP